MSTEAGAAPQVASPANAKGTLLRSIGAVLGGMLVGIVLTLLTDAVLHAAHVFPPNGQPAGNGPLVLATAYRIVYSVAASYLIARLAPHKPMQHALIGGFIGLAVCTAGAAATWNHTDIFGPHWYPIALVVTALPCAWVGAKLYARK